MHFPGLDGAHLTYCLNVHPGESWAQQGEAIRTHAREVKARTSPRQPFGLGLRISHRALAELEEPGQLAALRTLLAEQGMYVFTVNGFPYGPFHGQPVKTTVYRPDWRQPERTEYTCRLARLLAALLPEGLDGSISTVPLAYRRDAPNPADLDDMARALAVCAAALHDIREHTGRELHLGLEPEPDCLLETTAQTVDFFEHHLRPHGAAWLRRERGFTSAVADRLLARHIGICFDTCHLSVQFESLEASLATLTRHAIRISKVQLSAALRTAMTVDAARRLVPFCDAVYLHQAKVRDEAGQIVAEPDLTPEFLAGWAAGDPARECRIHFHVPLHMAECGGLNSTADDLTQTMLQAARAAGARHFEIETYTFDVLPPDLRRVGVAASIAAEFAWVHRLARGAATG